MKFKILLLFFSALSSDLYSQLNELPELEIYRPTYCDIKNCEPYETEYWENGDIKVEYKQIKDSLYLRNEYFKYGYKKIETEVILYYSVDSIFKFDPNTYVEEMKLDSQRLYPNIGQYKEYYRPTSRYDKENKGNISETIPILKSKGQFRYGYKVGEWEYILKRSGTKVICNYNDIGQFVGAYSEFYYSWFHKKYSKKIEGYFDLLERESVKYNFHSGKKYVRKVIENRRVGEWKYYSEDGEIIEIANYNWIGK